MNNDDDMANEEPPPSYEEATGRPSHTYRPTPPTLPPRPSNNTTKPSTAPAAPPPPAQTFQQIHPVASQAVQRRFPPSFNLYRDAFPGAQRPLFLGEHQGAPLYAVTAGWAARAGGSCLVLHNGPSDDHAPLATVAYSPDRRRMAVILPPPPARHQQQQQQQQPPPPPPPCPVHTPAVADPTFRFVAEVPNPGAGLHREAFEWRRSSSLAVGALGGRTHGWKLVRLCNGLPPGGLAVAGSGPSSGDGHEVVAVCAMAVMSMTKLWKMAFLGTGLSGVLGDQWAVLAVATGLITWDYDRARD